MNALGAVKIFFRTQFQFTSGGPHPSLVERHILSYPVTKHRLDPWGDERRSANQIFFKVLPKAQKYVGLVAHLPHGLPAPLREKLSSSDKGKLKKMEQEVWSSVHKKLDTDSNLTRLP